MKASVVLEKSSGYEVLDISVRSPQDSEKDEQLKEKDLPTSSLLILHKETETGSPFLVVAGYFLNEVGKFDQSVLAEIETIPESDYARLKEIIRKKFAPSRKTPITFW